MSSLREYDLGDTVITTILMKSRVLSAFTQPGSFVQYKAVGVNTLRDLRVTVGALQPSQSPRTPHSSNPLHAVELPDDGMCPSHGGPSMSFGIPAEDQMSIASLESELLPSGDEDEPQLLPSGVIAYAKSDSEVTAMLIQAATGIGLGWNPLPCSDNCG